VLIKSEGIPSCFRLRVPSFRVEKSKGNLIRVDKV
jgi:hypothetical protein